MSTEFVSRATGDLGFVRWAGKSGCRYEFGTVSNWENVVSWVRSGDCFRPVGGVWLDGDPESVDDFELLVASGRASFGSFPVTVELGSGEMARFTLEN